MRSARSARRCPAPLGYLTATGVAALLVAIAGCGRARVGGGPEPARRVVVLGFDGVDPDFVQQWAARLPTIAKLMKDGTFRRLSTTTPPASCTAWSSFSTGLDPGGHGVFDFIFRHTDTYLPDRTGAISRKAEYLWGLFETRPETFDSTMSGEPFWARVDRAGLRSVVLRVPCIYPLASMNAGRIEAGLGAPDVRGSEGTFHFWSSALTPRDAADPSLGGKVIALAKGAEIRTYIEGPADPRKETLERVQIPLILRPEGATTLEIELQGRKETVEVGRWSDWFHMTFKVTPFSSIAGMARFRVLSVEPEVELYLSPINHDPRDPAIAVSEPTRYAPALQAAVGDYKTVGWNHETWGLNEERLDDDAFMEDLFDTMAQTERITLHELDAKDAELLVSVFTETDRVSHMMYRLMDKDHPRYDAQLAATHGDDIQKTYQRMDTIIGEVLERLGPSDTLLIVSDHGFHSWRRGFNVNTWLIQEGYMRLRDGAASTDRKFLMDVDWSRTKAYALGVGAVYLNVRGREAKGIVAPGDEYRAVAAEIAHKLEQVVDPKNGVRAIERVYFGPDTWKGERLPEAQDLQLGMADGYRVSSATPLGGAPDGLFEDNLKKWSGDHATSRTDATEGILLSNRHIAEKDVSILDMAPTILRLLGLTPPATYDGKPLTIEGGA
jgi:predicted AlkP superfamily phosphohydrolase/phosphomutase